MSIVYRWVPLAGALFLPCLPAVQALAQGATDAKVVVTGNPLAREQTLQPASVLAGEGLALRRAGTLADTVDGLPGVASSWFGPNAGRPVIRGLDGDRIRLLDNGGASVDASSLSFDHASAIDPLVIERVEVLRGPAALLYGGSATGGVVNTLDGRIPRERLTGLSGRAELRLGGAAQERAAAAVLEGGQGSLAWHVDAFGRSSDDLRVPRFIPQQGGVRLPADDRVRNSAAEATGGAVGVGWAGRDGSLGVAVDRFATRYGVTAEPDVTIDMQRQRLSLAGAWRPSAALEEVSLQASRTVYRHDEVEGSGEIGTRFDSRGTDLRLQARHRPWQGLQGVWGLQVERLDFAALGEEAFVPATRTRSAALFALEEWRRGAWTWSAGLRREQVTVDAFADPMGSDRFGVARQRSFQPTSTSLGLMWAPASRWVVSASLGHTERAPAYYELFADGVHVATGAYERGDAALPVERSRHLETGVQWRSTGTQAKLSVFRTTFARYLSLADTGERFATGEGDELPVYAFQAVRARLQGFEFEARTSSQIAGWALAWSAGIDAVRGIDQDSHQPLPRLPPMRYRAALEGTRGDWTWAVTMRHAARQDRVPTGDVPTPGYTLVGAQLAWRARLGGGDALWFLRADNLGDRLAYNAGTVATLRGLAPLPGRSLAAGVRVAF